MPMVLERPLHPDDMLLVVGIGVIELFEDLRFFATGDIPVRKLFLGSGAIASIAETLAYMLS